MTLLNQHGNLNDDQHRSFEGVVGENVRKHLQSLLANGRTIADVRMTMHYLAMYLYGVESEVVLKEQIKMRRENRK